MLNAKVIIHPSSSEDLVIKSEQDRAAMQECLDNLASISTLLGVTAKGDHLTCPRQWLIAQLEQNYVAMEALMSGRGIG